MTFSARRWASPALVAAGAALIAAAVATGGASFFLVLVVPVFTGSSALFLLGALLLVLGLFALRNQLVDRFAGKELISWVSRSRAEFFL